MSAGNDDTTANDDAAAAIALAHALFDAARDGDTAMLARYLDAGVPITLTTAAGDSLLMLAAYNGHAVIVEDLLARGAGADQANDRGQTPLAGAVFKGHAEVVKLLAEAGADPDAGTPSARATAAMFERPDLAALFDR
ncbi:ankyrin repeat domain-containing protein [Arthrobacter echini]|uniref:Ankyrin repeat domain-containing protein n=1 Tax=Arthrobacter echini TaxID=1529066 RepID=A0A4S5E4N7_9MICC|nr:ankyrin repeat domain-containing protein [Arthrobacter echini]THJ66456.1 ankyrin repeat domain-containing protein [Arthrobacter echini]